MIPRKFPNAKHASEIARKKRILRPGDRKSLKAMYKTHIAIPPAIDNPAVTAVIVTYMYSEFRIPDVVLSPVGSSVLLEFIVRNILHVRNKQFYYTSILVVSTNLT